MQLQQVVDTVENLPPTPRILPKLQQLLRDMDAGIHDIISLLKIDAPMTAQIVRLSNSAYYGGTEPVQSLEGAVNRLGFREIYRVASTAAASQLLSDALPVYRLRKGELLESSVACAVMMVELASRTRRTDLDTAYTTGLLHSIGKVVINHFFMKHGLQIYATEMQDELDLTTERRLLGFDHADVGAAILEKWNFAQEIAGPVLHQLRPLEAEHHLASCCQLSIARHTSQNGLANDEEAVLLKIDPEVIKMAGLEPEQVKDAIADARNGLLEMEQMLR